MELWVLQVLEMIFVTISFNKSRTSLQNKGRVIGQANHKPGNQYQQAMSIQIKEGRLSITPQNLVSTPTRDAGDGVAITLSHNNTDIQGIWYYALNSLESDVTTLVQSWRNFRVF